MLNPSSATVLPHKVTQRPDFCPENQNIWRERGSLLLLLDGGPKENQTRTRSPPDTWPRRTSEWRQNLRRPASLSCRAGVHQTRLHNLGKTSTSPGSGPIVLESGGTSTFSESPWMPSVVKNDLMVEKHQVASSCQSLLTYLSFLPFKIKHLRD